MTPSVQLITSWGSDEECVASARMSTKKGFRHWDEYWECPRCFSWYKHYEEGDACHDCLFDGAFTHKPKGDAGFLAFLANNRHDGPFEFAGCTVEVCAPIFVARQWMRHRTQSYNEVSARYTTLSDDYYTPSVFRTQGKQNRQGSDERVEEQALVAAQYRSQVESNLRTYRTLLGYGVSKEQARMVLPVCMSTRWRATANPRNWIHFLSLRLGAHAQEEIRTLAQDLRSQLVVTFPKTMEVFNARLP